MIPKYIAKVEIVSEMPAFNLSQPQIKQNKTEILKKGGNNLM